MQIYSASLGTDLFDISSFESNEWYTDIISTNTASSVGFSSI